MKKSILPRVYFIYDPNNKAMKIGYTTLTLEERLSQIQVGNPIRLEIKYYINCETLAEAKNLEDMYHYLMRDLHIGGEWFKYVEERFDEIFSGEVLVESKRKRESLTRSTLYGDEIVAGLEVTPMCYFYGEYGHYAQILTSYEDSLNRKRPWRTMEWDTKGKQELLPHSPEVNRVWISNKKHLENLIDPARKKQKSVITL